ncbi:MAG: hypothetical protein HY908_35065 [Myxococcales bacterium]|nr:hypothetical protein [Myxococcales bacterium]
MRRALVGLAVAVGALAGCAVGRSFYASAGDWADYRRFRVAATLDARLSAASEYLAARPEGVFEADLRAWLERAEPVFYAHERGTRAGLERYLAALPHGAHAAEAVERLVAERARARRSEALGGVVALTERRLDLEIERRRAARAVVWTWVEGLLVPGVWREPFSRAPAAVLVPWSIALPEAECRNDWGASELRHCKKRVTRTFGAVLAGELVRRELALEVDLSFDVRGVVRGARLHGPELFTRLWEAEEAHAGAAGDGLASARAVATSRFAALFEAAGCGGVSSPLYGETRCGPLGLRAVLRGAGTSGEEDELTVWLEADDEAPPARPAPEPPAYPDE